MKRAGWIACTAVALFGCGADTKSTTTDFLSEVNQRGVETDQEASNRERPKFCLPEAFGGLVPCATSGGDDCPTGLACAAVPSGGGDAGWCIPALPPTRCGDAAHTAACPDGTSCRPVPGPRQPEGDCDRERAARGECGSAPPRPGDCDRERALRGECGGPVPPENRCQPTRDLQACDASGACPDGLHCVRKEKEGQVLTFCVADGPCDPGAANACPDGFACRPVPPKPPGDHPPGGVCGVDGEPTACADDAGCAPGLACVHKDGVAEGRCLPREKVACDPAAPRCPDGLVCRTPPAPPPGICMPDGEPARCSETVACADGLVCHKEAGATEGRCAPREKVACDPAAPRCPNNLVCRPTGSPPPPPPGGGAAGAGGDRPMGGAGAGGDRPGGTGGAGAPPPPPHGLCLPDGELRSCTSDAGCGDGVCRLDNPFGAGGRCFPREVRECVVGGEACPAGLVCKVPRNPPPPPPPPACTDEAHLAGRC